MKIQVTVGEKSYSVNLRECVSIAIDLDFDGPQPSHFGAEPAEREPMKSDGFIGSTNRGGSCNVDVLKVNPHCNGTHTESVGHIVSSPHPISSYAMQPLCVAGLVTVDAKSALETEDTYKPEFDDTDYVIAVEQLQRKVEESFGDLNFDALIVRTIPNDERKRTRQYNQNNAPTFFTEDAIRYVCSLDVEHLLVDLPSIDRMNDLGMMTNHHVFFGVSKTVGQDSEIESGRTITEMIYVPDAVEDGLYLLNLQIPAFMTDAAPSRPVLCPLRENDEQNRKL